MEKTTSKVENKWFSSLLFYRNLRKIDEKNASKDLRLPKESSQYENNKNEAKAGYLIQTRDQIGEDQAKTHDLSSKYRR